MAVTDFPIENLPYGVFRSRDGQASIGVAIEEYILDLRVTGAAGLLKRLPPETRSACAGESLNALMALSPAHWRELRARIVELLGANPYLVPMKEARMLVPAAIGDYTDFYASIFHATNVGRLFRPDNPLLPNYKHVPIAYHGRSSSIVASGSSIVRPHGQMKAPDAVQPFFGPTERLDYE